ncbi:MAG: hypothetical protein JOZ91_04440, partial [Candidatus Eremiobacteraeota bacterium]|nr:hypothetical protein [Candidatus Eremiobacteraeota bacterium]
AVHALVQGAATQSDAVRQLYQMLTENVNLISFNFLFRLSAIVFYASIPFAWLMPRVRPSGRPAMAAAE